MPAHRTPDYRKNICRISKVESLLLDIIEKIEDKESRKIVENEYIVFIKGEKKIAIERKKRVK